jgi:hypothetical protein
MQNASLLLYERCRLETPGGEDDRDMHAKRFFRAIGQDG